MSQEPQNFIVSVNRDVAVDETALSQLKEDVSFTFAPDEVVIVRTGYTNFRYDVGIVRSVSKTGQILLENGQRFLPSGKPIGASGGYMRLLKATPNMLEVVQRMKFVDYLKNMQWDMLPTSELHSVIDIIARCIRDDITNKR